MIIPVPDNKPLPDKQPVPENHPIPDNPPCSPPPFPPTGTAEKTDPVYYNHELQKLSKFKEKDLFVRYFDAYS